MRATGDVNPGDFAVRNENIIPESNQSKQSGQEWKCAVSEPAYDIQELMPYSEAAKAAVRFYTLTSAYGKPFERVSGRCDGFLDS